MLWAPLSSVSRLSIILFIIILLGNSTTDAKKVSIVRKNRALDFSIKAIKNKTSIPDSAILVVTVVNLTERNLPFPKFESPGYYGMFVIDIEVYKIAASNEKKRIFTQRPQLPILSFPGFWGELRANQSSEIQGLRI